jgi:hypothetical protein
MAARETLTDALTILRARGRTQVVMMDKDGRCCALGAIALANGMSADDVRREATVWPALENDPAVEALASVVRPSYLSDRTPVREVYRFNDDTDADAEVFQAFERAIESVSVVAV